MSINIFNINSPSFNINLEFMRNLKLKKNTERFVSIVDIFIPQ